MYDYLILATCAANTRRTRMLPPAATPVRRARLSLPRRHSSLRQPSIGCLGRSLNTRERHPKLNLPTTIIKSIDPTLLLHPPISKPQSQASFLNYISGSKAFRASSSRFSLSLFHFLRSCCYRHSWRERERIPNPYQDARLMGSYRFLEATKASKTT